MKVIPADHPNRKFTREQIEAAVEMVKLGHYVKDAAAANGMSASAFDRHFRKHPYYKEWRRVRWGAAE